MRALSETGRSSGRCSMPDSLTIEIPWPDKCLSPNGGRRHHHMKLNRLGKEIETVAWAETIAALDRQDWPGCGATLHIRGVYRNPAHASAADDDNLIAWMKKPRDGIAR